MDFKLARSVFICGWLAIASVSAWADPETVEAHCFNAGFDLMYDANELPLAAGPNNLRRGTAIGSWVVHTRGGSIIEGNEEWPERTHLLFRGADTVSYSLEAVFSEEADPQEGVHVEFDVRVHRSGTVDQWRNFIRILDDAGDTMVHLSISAGHGQNTRLSAWDSSSGSWSVVTDDLLPATGDVPDPVDGWDRLQVELNGTSFGINARFAGSEEWVSLATDLPLDAAPTATVSSILFEAGNPGARARYDRIEVTKSISLFDWSEVDERYPDIKYTFLETDDPRPLRIHALRVDLSNPDIRLHSTPRHENWGDPAPSYSSYTIRTGRQRTLNYLDQNRNSGRDMVAAINAAPWLPWGELPNWDFFGGWHKANYPYADEMGLAVSNGVLVDYPDDRPSLVFYRDWTAGIEGQPEEADLDLILTAVTGFDFALRNGGLIGTWMALEPRTGMGLCSDRRFLILMTIDGRQSGSEGASVPEVGNFLRFFGAWDGLNMDGGGSTTMALLNPENDGTSVVNSPATSFIEGSARSVGNNLGIYYITEPEPIEFDDWLRYRRVPESERSWTDDASGDGIPNLWAYAWNVHPMEGLQGDAPDALPAFGMRKDAHGTPILSVVYRKNRHAVDLEVLPEVTEDLRAEVWDIPTPIKHEEIDRDPVTGYPWFEVEVDTTGSEKMFMRLRAVSENP